MNLVQCTYAKMSGVQDSKSATAMAVSVLKISGNIESIQDMRSALGLDKMESKNLQSESSQSETKFSEHDISAQRHLISFTK